MNKIQSETPEVVPSNGHAAIRRVGIQGVEGSFHHVAASLVFPHEDLEVLPADTFEQLIQQTERNHVVDAGLMAIENSVAGSIMYNYHLLHESELHITGEVYLRIVQNLMAPDGASIDTLKEVHSHPMAIAQCRAFFNDYPHIRLVETEDTAKSAREIAEVGDPTKGAIASNLAAEMYSLPILARGIETDKQNYTRFWVLERPGGQLPEAEANKVSLCFDIDHEVGSLYQVLSVLAAYQVNLTKIQSSPILGRPWEYRFFIDFVASGKVGFAKALEAIDPLVHDLRVLGVYHKGQHFEY